MRTLLVAAAFVAFGCLSAAGGAAQTATKKMPSCTSTTGPVVWYVPASKKYYARGNARYGKGTGQYVCRADAMRMMKGGTASGATPPASSAGEMQNLPSTAMPRSGTGGTSEGKATPPASSAGQMHNLPSTPVPQSKPT